MNGESRIPTVTAAGGMAQALRLFRTPVGTVEVRVAGRLRGRFFRLERRAGVIVVDEDAGEVSHCQDDEIAVGILADGDAPSLRTGVDYVLAVAAAERDHPDRFLLVGHVVDIFGGMAPSFVVVGMSDGLSAFGLETDAVASLLPELMWRSGWTEGSAPDLSPRRLSELAAALPALVANA